MASKKKVNKVKKTTVDVSFSYDVEVVDFNLLEEIEALKETIPFDVVSFGVYTREGK